MVISAIAFTLLNAFVKKLNHFNVYQLIFFRALGSLFFTIPFLIKHKISPLGNKKKLLFLRSFLGLVSISCFFLAIKHIPMGTAVSVRYVSPLFAAIFAVLFLKERIKSLQWLFLFCAFIGVVILKGFSNSLSITGFVYALFSAVFVGLVYMVIRRIGNNDHPVVIVNHFMIVSAVVAGLLSINQWVTPSITEFIYLMSLGVFGYYAQVYLTKGLQIGEVNIVAPLKYLEVIFTIILGVIFFKENYTFLNVLGILIIIVSLSLNIYYNKK